MCVVKCIYRVCVCARLRALSYETHSLTPPASSFPGGRTPVLSALGFKLLKLKGPALSPSLPLSLSPYLSLSLSLHIISSSFRPLFKLLRGHLFFLLLLFLFCYSSLLRCCIGSYAFFFNPLFLPPSPSSPDICSLVHLADANQLLSYYFIYYIYRYMMCVKPFVCSHSRVVKQ